MSEATFEPINQKLCNLDYQYNLVASGRGARLSNLVNLAAQSEITKNILTGGQKEGTIVVTCNKLRHRPFFLPLYVTSITLGTAAVAGIPFSAHKFSMELSITIKDKNNKEIKTYTYSKSKGSASALYYGESEKVTVTKITKEIMKEFKNDLENDASNIIAQLTGSAPPAATSPKNYYAENNVIKTIAEPQPAQPIMNNSAKSDVDLNIPVTGKKAENTFVLIIANEDYSFVDDVDFAINDGKAFKEYCVKTLGVPERQVWLYENASYGIINAGVSKMTQAMNFFENPKAIIFYCGHGIPDEKTNDAYIIPTDGNGKDMATCYSLNKLYKTFADTKASQVTYFMDACFTGASKNGNMLVAARGVAIAPKKEVLGGNAVVFSATSDDETAMAFKEKQHGMFTYFLLKKLQETKGEVNYSDLYDYIKYNVKKESFLTNEKPQTPVIGTSQAVKDTWKTMTFK